MPTLRKREREIERGKKRDGETREIDEEGRNCWREREGREERGGIERGRGREERRIINNNK